MIRSLLVVLMLLKVSGIWGQQVEAVAARYPNDYAVILQHTEEVRIFMNNGVPVAESRISRQILILDDKANGIYNRYGIYHGSFSELKDIEAYTVPAAGSRNDKIKVTDIREESGTDKGVFYDDVRQSIFDFPALKKGAVAHVSYTVVHKDGHLLSPFYLSSYIPVVNARFTVLYPKEIELAYTIRNNSPGLVNIKEEKKGSGRLISFEASGIKEVTRFNDAPDFRYYEPHIIYRITSVLDKSGVKKGFLGTVDDLFRWNYSFIRDLDNQHISELKPRVDSITGNATDEEEKARRIYRWVQQNIKYVAFENGLEGFVPRHPLLIYNRRFGDCKDMASLITAMLRQAGIKAWFAWIGTRSIPYDYEEVPLPITDNHMISVAQINGRWVFLDGTDPGCLFGFPSAFIQGKQAMVALGNESHQLIRIPVMEPDRNKVVDSTFITLQGKGFRANSRVYYYGYSGSDMYNSLLYKSSSGTRDYVKLRMGKASNNFLLGSYNISNRLATEGFMNINADFEVPEYGKQIGEEIYINLNLEKVFTSGSLFDTAKRKVPSAIEQQFLIDQYTFLTIPQGYQASYVPEGFTCENEDMFFSISYEQTASVIVARQVYRRKTLLIPPARFSSWNSNIRKLLALYREQVVLKKTGH